MVVQGCWLVPQTFWMLHVYIDLYLDILIPPPNIPTITCKMSTSKQWSGTKHATWDVYVAQIPIKVFWRRSMKRRTLHSFISDCFEQVFAFTIKNSGLGRLWNCERQISPKLLPFGLCLPQKELVVELSDLICKCCSNLGQSDENSTL